jgi:hypothetical protein
MDIGKSFTFVFDDKDWIKKVAIAAGILALGILFFWLLFIPTILAIALLGGYMVEIIRRVLRGEMDGLPEWDNWGVLMADGLKVWVIGVVYALPILILSLCLSIPIAALSDRAEGLSSLLSVFLSCISLLYAIAVTLVLPAATAAYAATNDLGAAFRFGQIFRLVGDNLPTYLITLVMTWVASAIGSLGSLVCGVGWLATFPYSYMVIGHLYGQAYLESTGKAQPPAPDVEALAPEGEAI